MSLNDPLFISMVGIAFLLAIATGANDETFAAVVGSKRLTIKAAVMFGAVLAVIGALLLGGNVSSTIGEGISDYKLSEEKAMVLAILVAMSISLILASIFGLPISSTHAMVGAVSFVSIYRGGMNSVNWAVLGKVGLSWIVSPLLGFAGAYFFMKIVQRVMKSRTKGLNDVERNALLFANFLLIAVVVTAVSRAGNDVSNAVAPIYPTFKNEGGSMWSLVPFMIGGVGLAIGLLLLGSRVLRTLGSEIVELTPESAFAVQAATAIIVFVAANLGIPVSGTQILVASFVGVGVAVGQQVNYKTIRRIVVSALMTPFFSGGLAILLFFGIDKMGVV